MKKRISKSKPYLSGEYEEMFNAAEIASMAAEDIGEYRTSIMRELERQSELDYQRKEGEEKGMIKGEQKARIKMAPPIQTFREYPSFPCCKIRTSKKCVSNSKFKIISLKICEFCADL